MSFVSCSILYLRRIHYRRLFPSCFGLVVERIVVIKSRVGRFHRNLGSGSRSRSSCISDRRVLEKRTRWMRGDRCFHLSKSLSVLTENGLSSNADILQEEEKEHQKWTRHNSSLSLSCPLIPLVLEWISSPSGFNAFNLCDSFQRISVLCDEEKTEKGGVLKKGGQERERKKDKGKNKIRGKRQIWNKIKKEVGQIKKGIGVSTKYHLLVLVGGQN